MTTTSLRPPVSAPPPEPEHEPLARGRRGLAGWGARWRVALRIARRNARRNRLSTAIATTLIALPVAAAVFLLSFLASTNGTPLSVFDALYGADTQAAIEDVGCGGCVVEQSPAANSFGWSSEVSPGVDPTTRIVASELPGRDVVAWPNGTLAVSAGDIAIGTREVSALPADRIGEVYVARTGRLPAGDGEAALLWREAEHLGVSEGDTVTVGGVDLTVTGIIDSRNRPAASVLTVPGALDLPHHRWLVLGAEPVTWAEVQQLNTHGVTVTSREVIADPPPDYGMWGGPGHDTATIGIAAAVVTIAVIEAVLLVGPAFAVGTRRQTRSLALLAASGGSRRDVHRVVLASGVVVGLVAAAIGTAIGIAGLGVVWWVSRSGWTPLPSFTVPLGQVLLASAFAVGLGLLAALVPARAVSRLDVTAALAGRRAEATASRRVPWLGLGLVAVGLAAAVAGAHGGVIAAVVGGIIALEIGMVLTTGTLLAWVARLAPRFGVAGRFALRDALRQRSRTIPAVASIIAAVAAVVAGAVYVATDDALQSAWWSEEIGVGTITISGDYDLSPEGLPAVVDAALETIGEEVPVAAWAPVLGLRGRAEVQVNPARACPADEATTEAEHQELRQDPRCRVVTMGWGSPWRNAESDGVLVDDGTAVAVFTSSLAAEAAAALARGEIVVFSADDIWDDGTAHLLVWDEPWASDGEQREIVAPAFLADIGAGPAILPASVVAEYPTLGTVQIGAVARTDVAYDDAWAQQVRGSRGAAHVEVKQPHVSYLAGAMLALVGVAALVALAATWLSVALAGAETRPDLATLAAVGAPPRVTRRIASAQAGVVAVVGVGVGVVLGMVLGWVLATWTLKENFYVEDLRFAGLPVPGVAIPWLWVLGLAVALPALAVAGAWLTAPRRLPLVRRLAQ